MRSFLPPMLLATGTPRARRGWVAQPKLDGWRAQVVVDDRVTVRSRNGHPLKVPEVDELLVLARGRRVRLDGELVVMAGPLADWHALCDRMRRGASRSRYSVGFFVFDLLELDGVDLTSWPWMERQEQLRSLELRATSIGVVPVLEDVDEAWSTAQMNGWEGVVYKRTASPWRAGERSADGRERRDERCDVEVASPASREVTVVE